VLHVSDASKNLLSVHQFTSDDDVYLEFRPSFFCVKGLATKDILLQGICCEGLYPLPRLPQVHQATKPSTSRWHRRLGQPSPSIVQRVLREHKLDFVSDSVESVCGACQQAKNHRLPYSQSSCESTFPLQLVFSDVWGLAPHFVGRCQYYVSFIDDFSKFTWIYLLKNRSDVYQVFLDFEQLVERRFDKKIITLQTDWGGEYQKLHSFFNKVGITHHVSCPHTHQKNGSAERKRHHIVEVGPSLLTQASMPLKFWDEAFLTSTILLIVLLVEYIILYPSPKIGGRQS
jgi:histone deacetylase 1/2